MPDHAPNAQIEPLRAEHLRAPIFNLPGSSEEFRARILESAQTTGVGRVAIVNEAPVGYAAVIADGGEAEVSVFVDGRYGRRGIATRLVRAAITAAFAERDVRRIVARTRVGRPGSKLVERLGLQPVSTVEGEHHYEIDEAAWRRLGDSL